MSSSRRTIAARLLVDEGELERRPLDDVNADLEALGIDPRPAIERAATQAEALCRDMNRDAAHDCKPARVGPAASEPGGQTTGIGSRRFSPTAIGGPIRQSDGDKVPYEPQPARRPVEPYRGRTSSWARPFGWLGIAELGLAMGAASIAVLVLASGIGGWMLSDRYGQPEPEAPAFTFTQQALNAHLEYSSHAQHRVEFDAEQENRFLLWLSERLGQPVQAPNLADLGFTLVGGRLLPAAGQAAAQLTYENPDAQRITLDIRRSPSGAAHEGTVNFTHQGDLSTVYWVDGPLAYALGGELDREQLFAIAKIVQQQRAVPHLPAPEQTTTTEKRAHRVR
jgi:anti-sigma factor RsiW